MCQESIQQCLAAYPSQPIIPWSASERPLEQLTLVLSARDVRRDVARDYVFGVQPHHGAHHGARQWGWDEWAAQPLHMMQQTLLQVHGQNHRVTLHCDLSAIAAPFVPGATSPEPVGLDPAQLRGIYQLAGRCAAVTHLHFSGWDEHEVLPQATVALITQCIWYASKERAL